MRPDDTFPLKYEEAMTKSELAVFEIDPKLLFHPSTAMLFASFSKPEDKEGSLRARLGKKYGEYKKRYMKLKVNLDWFAELRPSFVYVAIPLSKLKLLGFESEKGIEFQLYRSALENKIPTAGLELPADQIEALKVMDSESVFEQMDQMEVDLTDFEALCNELLLNFKNGDLDAVHAEVMKFMEDFPEVASAIMTDRNRNWVESIESLLQEHKTLFVVVGAGHIPGEDGLLDLLKKRNYELTRL